MDNEESIITLGKCIILHNSIYDRFEHKNLPVDVLQLTCKHDEVLGFYWDSHGSKFCIIHIDSKDYNLGKCDFSFFDAIPVKKNVLRCIEILRKKACNNIYWSSKRYNAVLADIRPLRGMLEFFNLDFYLTFRIEEHYNCIEVSWDSTGRFVATMSDKTQYMEHRYIIWSFDGIKLCRISKIQIEIFTWRPSPVVLLNLERSNMIDFELKHYYFLYSTEAQLLIKATINEILVKRRKMLEEFDDWFDQQMKKAIRRKKEILAKYPWLYKNDQRNIIDRTDIEEHIDYKEEFMI